MNSSQRNSALVFLAAIAMIAFSKFASGPVIFILVVVFILGMTVGPFYRNRRAGRSLVSGLLAKMLALCVITSIASFAITEFEDFQARRLSLFPQAVTQLDQSAEAAHLLGSPIRVSWPVKASGNLSNSSGETQLSIPVTGAISRGRLIADGTSVGGAWTITTLQLLENGTVTNLQSGSTIH